MVYRSTQKGTFNADDPTLVQPDIKDSIDDINGLEMFKFTATASAINEFTFANASIGTDPSITASGDDTNINLVLAGKGTGVVSIGAASLTSPIIITSINDANDNELFLLTATSSAINQITLANASIGTNPSLIASGDDTNVSLVLDGQGTGGVLLSGTSTDGLNISGICGDAIEISGAATITGINISADCITGITIAAQATMGIALAVAAGVGGIAIDAGTVNHAADGSIVDINLDIEGQYSVNAINVNLDFETTGMAGTDVTTAFKADINELLVHTDGAGLHGTDVTITGFATGRCDLVGHNVLLDGTKTAGDTSAGFKVTSTAVINHSGENVYGQHIDFSGMTLTDGNAYGTYTDMSFTNGSTSYGHYLNMGTDSTAGISINGTAVTGIMIAATCPTGIAITGATGYALDITTAGVVRMGIQGAGIPVTTAYPFGFEIQTAASADIVPGATGSTAGIYSRYEVAGDQTTQASHISMFGKLRVKADLADGTHAGVFGYVEISEVGTVIGGTSTTTTAAGHFAIEADTNFELSTGHLNGVCIDSSVHAGATLTGSFIGMRIKKGGSAQAWESGITIEDTASTIGINIGTCTTGINFGIPSGSPFKFVSDDTIVSDANQAILVDISATANDGFIKVILDSSTVKYIALYDTKTT